MWGQRSPGGGQGLGPRSKEEAKEHRAPPVQHHGPGPNTPSSKSQATQVTNASSEPSACSSFLLKRRILKRNPLQTAEMYPSLAPFSYLSEGFREVIFRLPHEIVILSTCNSSSNVSSLIASTLEKLCSAPSHGLGRQRPGFPRIPSLSP